jgi:CO/xanthine dehydrogenase Mo-binding subunit
VHPVACKNQLDGGSVMGLGDAMYEEMIYGDGQLLNGHSFQYRLPLLYDLPPRFTSIRVRGPRSRDQHSVSTIPGVKWPIAHKNGERVPTPRTWA